MSASLWSAFAPALPGANDADPVVIERALAELVGRAHVAWPELTTADPTFVAFVAARLPSDADLVTTLAAARADDLYLSCACLAGEPAAHRAFDALLARSVDLALGRMGAAPDERRDVGQEVHTRLLVGDGTTPPRLAAYTGRGDLRGFVRAVAVRAFLTRKRGDRSDRNADDSALERLAAADEDPALAIMRVRYADSFRRAFHAAVGDLTPRDRALLRYTYLDGLGLDQLATIYQVSRATAHRHLVKARETLGAAVEAHLVAELDVSSDELHSLRRVIQGDLDLSLRRVLGAPA